MLYTKLFCLSLLVACTNIVFSQRSVDSLVQTEKQFASTSLVAGTKDAFLKFIDTSGIVFDQGKPVNGFKFYTNSDRRPGILSWEPEYAEISYNNDFGYTTGPWKYHTNSLTDDPVARGHFVSVWHLSGGEWKFLIDFGISYRDAHKTSTINKVLLNRIEITGGKYSSMEHAEAEFIKAYASQGAIAYMTFLSSRSRINYAGFLPATNETDRKALLDSLPREIEYKTLGSVLSPAGDIDYVYGTTKIDEKQDGYLRIWRREKNGWKIALEVLHFK